MKRFWTEARVEREGEGWTVRLDGRPLRTPGKLSLAVPSHGLAEAIAAEWNAAEKLDPRAMPLTGLANAAIERVAADPAGFAAGLAKYAEGDLLCYRAESPDGLVQLQSDVWDPLLDWARGRFDAAFETTTGIRHVPQPARTVERLATAVAALDPFRLAGLAPLVTIGGSLIAALAVVEVASRAEEAWHAVSVDERWQIDTWGADEEAVAALDGRRRDWLAASRFLELLKA